MSINFPTSLDTLSNPVGTDKVNNAVAALKHATQHANANDAIEALEAKVGINGSAVTTSHDYKLSSVTGTDKAVSKASASFVGGKVLVSSANHGAVESDLVVQPGGLVGIAQGGLGVALTDPNANKLIGWDDATNANDWVTIGSGLTLAGKTLTASSSNLTTTQTANEDLTAGTPVGISPIIGGVAKAVKGSYTQTITPSSGLEERTIKIATDKIVTVYAQSGTITTLKVFAATVNTSSFTSAFTVGAEQTVTTTLNTSGSSSIYDIGKLDDDKFFITYAESGAPTILRLVIGTISGTTITLGTPVNAYTLGATITNTNAQEVSTDKGLMIVSASSGNAYGIAFTASGTVATTGTPLDLGGTSTGASVSCLVGTDKVALSIEGNVRIITLSGTTLTVGTLSSYDGTATNATAYHDIVSHQNDGFIVRNQKAGGSGYEVIAGTVSGTTITLGTLVNITAGGGMYVISPTQFLLQETISASSQFFIYSISGSTIDTNYTISNGISTQRRGIIDMGTYFLALDLNSSTLTYYFGGMSPGFIGFAQSTVSKGSSVTVVLSGIDSNQTGLIAGSYYLVSAGALTTIISNRNINSLNDTAVVKAISTTSVIF